MFIYKDYTYVAVLINVCLTNQNYPFAKIIISKTIAVDKDLNSTILLYKSLLLKH